VEGDPLNLSQLRFVRAVTDAGTFTGGAARCYVTQSTLSTAIAHLEKELGERLFVRTTRSVKLTPFGLRLLPMIDDVLRAQAALVDAAEEFLDPKSRVARVGVCPLVESTRLERILAPYGQGNRNVKVVLEQTGSGHGRRALEEGWLDVVLGPATPGRSPKLERAKLYEDPLVYLRAGEAGLDSTDPQPVRLEDIARDEFLLVHDACGLTRLTRQLFASRRLPLREYAGQAVSYQVLEEWARVGVGSAILPRSKLSTAGVGHPIVLGNGHRATIKYEAIWAPSTNRAPHLQALTEHLKSASATLALSR
jgi:LysR family transcriptional regulator, hydrogen peroxide-inducible genes activator